MNLHSPALNTAWHATTIGRHEHRVREVFLFLQRMQFNESERSTLESAAGILRALAHPLRVCLLNYIEFNQPAQVFNIHTDLGLDQSITSQHLRILRDTGLVTTQREGKSIYYLIDHPYLAHAIKVINDFDSMTLTHRKKKR